MSVIMVITKNVTISYMYNDDADDWQQQRQKQQQQK